MGGMVMAITVAMATATTTATAAMNETCNPSGSRLIEKPLSKRDRRRNLSPLHIAHDRRNADSQAIP